MNDTIIGFKVKSEPEVFVLQMRRLPEKSFAKQQKLLELRMDDNEISNVTSLTFFGLKSLVKMSLRGNDIEHIAEGTFNQLTKVKTGDFINDNIENITRSIFT